MEYKLFNHSRDYFITLKYNETDTVADALRTLRLFFNDNPDSVTEIFIVTPEDNLKINLLDSDAEVNKTIFHSHVTSWNAQTRGPLLIIKGETPETRSKLKSFLEDDQPIANNSQVHAASPMIQETTTRQESANEPTESKKTDNNQKKTKGCCCFWRTPPTNDNNKLKEELLPRMIR